ncbi:transposase [Flagellimonas pelagia]|uniref:IS110 family transposase n=1 Tax=Flagellimonas pelagia TaxID=2306998 RepID=A0A3A1NLU7_9FLAO|nr:hypothetical protein D2V05_01780 [Allomuricauda maritima]TXK00954.1 IS110 family transposase [Allomuricauda maritima]
MDKIARIKGIRRLTIVRVLAETDGFQSLGSIRRLVSYSGLEVVHNSRGQSSNFLKGDIEIIINQSLHVRRV